MMSSSAGSSSSSGSGGIFPLVTLPLLLAALVLPISTAFTGAHGSAWRTGASGPGVFLNGKCRLTYSTRNTKITLGRMKPQQQGSCCSMTTAVPSAEQQAHTLKQTILETALGTSNGLEATSEQREVISKAVNGLVGLNPTEDMATSELATGMWDLVYTTTPGASAGRVGPFIGEVQQEVDIARDTYVNYVRLGPLTGKLVATWEVANAHEWKVIFKTIAYSLWGTQLIELNFGLEGMWTLTYIDDDMRILTARSLETEPGNLYVLARA